uniref:SAP domain-containing protein n=1 Tax=Anopheles coluzzii TaxID=1518534 RepID=A0A6E8VJQ4_ANOCL
MDFPASIEELMEQFTRVGLVKRCEALGLDTSGSKEELAGRIVEHSESGNQATTRVGDYLDAVEGSSTSSQESVDREARGVSIHFKDVQDYLPTFSGKEDVCAWVIEFETRSKLLKWHDLHKLIYAKRVLQGAAKAFVRSIPEVSSWIDLKHALVEEFEEKVSSATVHESLRRRKKK